MSDRSCAVEGCDREPRTRGLCGMHYARLLRTGNLGPSGRKNFPLPADCEVQGCGKHPKAKGLCDRHLSRLVRNGDVNNPGTFTYSETGLCVIDGCGRRHHCKGFCKRHYRRWRNYGDPEGKPIRPPVGYIGAHQKVYELRGPASGYLCKHCGKSAIHWAYDHGDPGERIDIRRGPYSLDPERYIPLCASCHKIFDNKRRVVPT